jgi:hypothetical protein
MISWVTRVSVGVEVREREERGFAGLEGIRRRGRWACGGGRSRRSTSPMTKG